MIVVAAKALKLRILGSSMTEPLLVEIVAYAPTAFYHCTHCEVAWRAAGVTNHIHDEQVSSSLPPDLAQEYAAISEWVRQLFREHCDRVAVKVVDAASLEGFFKMLRYGLHRPPAVIVARKARFGGGVADALAGAGQEIDRQLDAPRQERRGRLDSRL
jgi:hypothetical protein